MVNGVDDEGEDVADGHWGDVRRWLVVSRWYPGEFFVQECTNGLTFVSSIAKVERHHHHHASLLKLSINQVACFGAWESGEALARCFIIPHQLVEKVAPQSGYVYEFLFGRNNVQSDRRFPVDKQ